MQYPSLSEALTLAGLTDREAHIWQVLTEAGPLNISQLAEMTQLHRPAVYALLPSLKAKGLLKEVKEKRRVLYRTTGVEVLKDRRASRDAVFAKQLKKLKKNDSTQDISDDVHVYHGKDMRRVWKEVLEWGMRGRVLYRYDGYGVGTQVGLYMPADYYKITEKKHLDRFVITNQALRASAYKKRLECASRVLPGSFDSFEQGVSQFIFGNKIALVDFKTETAFIIRNAVLAAYHAKLFQYLYRNLKND